jgi:hypothetical protein
MPVARDTTAGRVFNDLRNLARRTGRGTDELLLTYSLERFLFRLSSTPDLNGDFVLKGGLLLAQFGARRPTRDIDLLGRSFPNDETEVVTRIAAIASLTVDDGVVFDPDTVRPRAIRETEDYAGLRITMAAHIARARVKLQLDVSFGDPVTPDPRLIDYPQQLIGETFPILGYPLETVVAEKLTTAIALGDANTRDRDYADLYRLITLHAIAGDSARTALDRTAIHRGVRLAPLSEVVRTLPERRQGSYRAWRGKQGPDAVNYPDNFAETVALVCRFADPLLAAEIANSIWDPTAKSWL